MSPAFFFRCVLLYVAVPGFSGNAAAQCPEYTTVREHRIDVSVTDDLQAVLRDVSPGTAVYLEDGTYFISSNLQLTVDSVTLRSKSGNRDMVILDGNPDGGELDRMNFTPEVVAISASDVHLVDLSIRYARDHGIHIYPPQDRPIAGCVLHNLHVYDCGQQLIKVNSNGNNSALYWVDRGVVQGSLIEFIDNSVMQDMGDYFYTGGIDVHGGQGWIIRWNHFRNIQRDGKLMEHAVHFWSRSRETIVENNRFENVYRGIGFGMKQSADGLVRSYDDTAGEDPYFDHIDGLIRNNTIVNTTGVHLESGIEVWSVTGTEVYHNTVYSADEPFSSIECRWAEGISIANNLVSQRVMMRDAVTMSVISSNLAGVGPGYFVNAANGDLHLSETAELAIDNGEVIENSGVDIDGGLRDALPDIGADEFGSAAAILSMRRGLGRIAARSAGRYTTTLLGRMFAPHQHVARQMLLTVSGRNPEKLIHLNCR